jgi:translocator protein
MLARMKRRSWPVLVGLIVLCVGTGAIAGLSTSRSVTDWYPSLIKPAWNPPAWLFGPVWTVLYITMAVAAWLVWQPAPRPRAVRVALTLFFVQLVLNGAWSLIFFGARALGPALAEILLMLFVIALTARAFFRESRLAGALMLPYLAWVGFATFLNFTIWRLNRG